jgi:hypothetical protein
VAPGPVLVRTAGYHPAARAYLDWAGDLELPDLGDAQDLLGEWVGDFPFASDSDRAHWFASLLAPMMRGVIRGPVPLTVYEAPAPGTGKSLLMMVTARVASGRTVAPAALSSNEDERRKAMLAHLGAGPPVVCLDNVTGTVNDDVLAGVITAWPRYTDRRMGGQSLMSVPAISSWCMSANNATMSPDIARRMVRVRLDSREASPELRTGFRHPNLTSWTEKEAPHLRAAALALVWAWAEAGSPAWDGKALGSFESWSRNVGAPSSSSSARAPLPSLCGSTAAHMHVHRSRGWARRPAMPTPSCTPSGCGKGKGTPTAPATCGANRTRGAAVAPCLHRPRPCDGGGEASFGRGRMRTRGRSGSGLRAEGPAVCPDGGMDAREVARWVSRIISANRLVKTSTRPHPPRPSAHGPSGGGAVGNTGQGGYIHGGPNFCTPIEDLVLAWDRCPEVPAVLCSDARAAQPETLPEGTVAYMDPPYLGTTGYAHDLGRPEVVELARRWADAGAVVCISEAEPIPELMADGWYSVDITETRRGRRGRLASSSANG